jgi:hypothetical protein
MGEELPWEKEWEGMPARMAIEIGNTLSHFFKAKLRRKLEV